MKFETSTVKGFQDYLPPESIKRKVIIRIIEKYYKLYGFLPIETPIIEFDELMSSKITNNILEDEAVADRFRLKDRGGRNLGLRYEFTFQLARIFRENPNIKMPFRRYQTGPVFRDEPIRQGRTRQFIQCDVDIIGDSSINADVECISVLSDILKELKINSEIRVNNRKLLNAIVESVEINEKDQVMRELDKIDKIGIDYVKANLKKYVTTNQIITLFKLLEKDLSFFKENAFEGAAELEELIKKCNSYGIKAIINLFMVRGLSYYTGNIFEFAVPGKKISLAGGGRYDKTVGKYINRDIPAVGISFSLESLMNLCEDEIAKLKVEPYPKTIIISIERDKESINLAKKLRKNNISCFILFDKISKALEYSNSTNIPYVIFLGGEEVLKNKYKLKDMKSGNEVLLSEKQLIAKLEK